MRVMRIVSTAEHPRESVTVSEYVVEAVTSASGLLIAEVYKAEDGCHEYNMPPLPWSCTNVFPQTDVSLPASAEG